MIVAIDPPPLQFLHIGDLVLHIGDLHITAAALPNHLDCAASSTKSIAAGSKH